MTISSIARGKKFPNPLTVISDDREPKAIMKTMEDRGVIVIVQHLDVGDYIVSKDVCIERKTGSDLVMSIKDKRFFEQLVRLQDTYEIAILVIEDIKSAFRHEGGMAPQSIYGALAYVVFKLGIPIVPTASSEHTALLVERLAFQAQVGSDDPVMSRKAPKGMTKKERKAYIMEGLWTTGPVTAQKMIDNFGDPISAMQAIKDTNVVFSKSGKPKRLEGPVNGIDGIGPKYVLKNKELLS